MCGTELVVVVRVRGSQAVMLEPEAVAAQLSVLAVGVVMV
jgi:hypothetical protein